MKRLVRPYPQTHLGLICSILLLGCLFAPLTPWLTTNRAAAQTPLPDLEGYAIAEVQVAGNSRISTSAILAKVHSQPGQTYRSETINRDIKSVQKIRGIQAVYVTAKITAQRLSLTFQVAEEPLVRSIEIDGNRRFPDDELYELLPITTSDFADTYSLARGREALLAHYHKSGYQHAQVKLDTSLLPTQAKLIYRIVEGPRTRIRKITFQGNQQVADAKLRSQIATKPHTFIFSAGNLDLPQLDNDIAKLVQYLREKGYLDAKVGKRLDYSPDQKWVSLTFLVSEGYLYRIRQIRFVGNENVASQDLQKKLKLHPGDVPIYSVITRTNTQRILEVYGRKGFVDAQIRFAPVYLRDQPGLLDLVYSIAEGPQFHVGTIDIFGNEVTQDRVIRRQLLLAPNDLYDTTKLQRSRMRLMESRLFDQVDISDVPAPDFKRNLKISVTEGPTAMLLMGVAVNSDAGLLGEFSFTQQNFDLFDFPTFRGAGQYFRLRAQPGSELNLFSVDFREPYVADLPISFGQSIYLRSRFRDDYDEDRLGALWSLGYRFGDGWEIEGAVGLEEVTIRDIVPDTAKEIKDGDGSHDFTTVKGTIIRDKTDSIFLPSTGDIFRISYEQTGVFGGDFDFGRIEVGYTRYFTTHADSLGRKGIFAFRVRGSKILGDAPFFERYYAGGIYTIRGFDFRGVSPRVPSLVTATPTAVGSDWLVLAGAEYSIPLVGKNLRAAAFLDTAAIDDKGPYRVSTGVSIRLMVPFLAPIPLSFDFGWPLTKDDDDDTRVFSFNFATSF